MAREIADVTNNYFVFVKNCPFKIPEFVTENNYPIRTHSIFLSEDGFFISIPRAYNINREFGSHGQFLSYLTNSNIGEYALVSNANYFSSLNLVRIVNDLDELNIHANSQLSSTQKRRISKEVKEAKIENKKIVFDIGNYDKEDGFKMSTDELSSFFYLTDIHFEKH